MRNNTNKFSAILIAIALYGISAQADTFEVPEGNLFVPHKLAVKSSLKFENKEFHLTLDGKGFPIHPYNIRGQMLCSLERENVEKFLEFGYFVVGKTGEDYTLTAKGRLLGGIKDDEKEEDICVKLMASGAAAGGTVGSAIGTAVPVIGTAVGGFIGGAGGGTAGLVACAFFKSFMDKAKK